MPLNRTPLRKLTKYKNSFSGGNKFSITARSLLAKASILKMIGKLCIVCSYKWRHFLFVYFKTHCILYTKLNLISNVMFKKSQYTCVISETFQFLLYYYTQQLFTSLGGIFFFLTRMKDTHELEKGFHPSDVLNSIAFALWQKNYVFRVLNQKLFV